MRVDSVGAIYAGDLRRQPIVGTSAYKTAYDGKKYTYTKDDGSEKAGRLVDIDSLFRAGGAQQRSYIQSALNIARRNKQNYEFKALAMSEDRETIRRHAIELQKKFTLSFACIIFFFIGAPLGAIIRKGGLGMPLVISVFLFIFYYIIDNTGYKLARDGRWEVWEGMWLSAAVLLPLGIFFTYKAVNDSAVFNADAYRNFIRRLLGKAPYRVVTLKELVMDDVDPQKAIEMVAALRERAERVIAAHPLRRWVPQRYDQEQFDRLSAEMEAVVTYLGNSRDVLVINKLMDFPVFHTTLVGKMHMGRGAQVHDARTVVKVCNELIDMLTPKATDKT